MCWIVRPLPVSVKPMVLSDAVGVILLASRRPSVVKYQILTYSMALILSRANCAGKKGSLSGTGALRSNSGKMTFFLLGTWGVSSGWGGISDGGEGEGGVGGGRG